MNLLLPAVIVVLMSILVIAVVSFRTLPLNQVLIQRGLGIRRAKVCSNTAVVLPVIHDAMVLDLQDIMVEKVMGVENSCICKDMIKADLELAVTFCYDRDHESLIELAEQYAFEDINLKVMKYLSNALTDSVKKALQELDFDEAERLKNLEREIWDTLKIKLVESGLSVRDVSIIYFGQCPIEEHDFNTVHEVKGRAKIDSITKDEIDQARKREEADEDNQAKFEKRQVARRYDKEKAAKIEKKLLELEVIATERELELEELARKMRVRAEKFLEEAKEIEGQRELRLQAIRSDREQSLEQKEKDTDVEKARLIGETAIAEAGRILSEALCAKLNADAAAATAEEEISTRRGTAKAEREASVLSIREKNEVNLDAHRTTKLAQAKLDSTELEFSASDQQSEIIRRLGSAEAEVIRDKLEAGNHVEDRQIVLEALREIAPRLPEIIEKAMIPAEQIDSIKILHVDGMGTSGPPDSTGSVGKLLGLLLGGGVVLPLAKKVFEFLGGEQILKDAVAKYREPEDVPDDPPDPVSTSGSELPPV